MYTDNVMWAKQKGFTLVELLIVISVIAILAAITIVAYRGVQARTQETSVRNDLKNMANQVHLYRADGGQYPSSTQLQTLGIHINKQTYGVNPVGATIFYCVSDDGKTFSIVARVKSSLILRYASYDSQVVPYAGSGTAPQLCLDSGVSGTTSTVNYTAFTENGDWYSWVLD